MRLRTRPPLLTYLLCLYVSLPTPKRQQFLSVYFFFDLFLLRV